MIKKPNRIVTYLFNEYKSINEKIPYINSGGCGVFAEKLFNLLIKLNLNPKLIVLTNNARGMTTRIRTGSYRTGAYITHIVIKLNGFYLDSTGIYKTINKIGDYHGYGNSEINVNTKLTIDVLRNWVEDEDIWNDRFNRDHVKKIDKTLNKSYLKLKKDLVISK